ncbi:MAG: glycosyltransferase [Bacteroidetes bacterium]|nr:glycosyltransferase [Bacteroidota bacterium]
MSAPSAPAPFTVSLCMIVKNEERYLRGCLESARPFVDEIVIVDTGSTDTTVGIAQEFGAVIRTFPWNGNFSDARNESLRHATGDWILYLDADERLMNGDALRQLRPSAQTVAYNVSISSKHILPSGTVDQVNQYQRFFRRHPKIRFEGVVHEQVLPSLLRMNKRIEDSPLFIEHLGYGESLEKIQQKCERNAALLRRQLELNPHDYYAHYQLGNTLGVMLRYDEAEKHLRLAVEHDRNVSIRASACNILVETAMHRNDLESAERWCRQSVKLVPVQVMGHWFLSGILAHRQQYDEALRSIDTMRSNAGRPTGLAHDLQVPEGEINYRTIVCYEGLANAAMAASDLARAHLLVTSAEERGIRSPKLQTIGIQTAMALNDLDTALRRIDFMLRNLPPDAESQRARFRAVRSRIESMAVA